MLTYKFYNEDPKTILPSCYIKFNTKLCYNYETPSLSTQRVHKTPMKTNALDDILSFLDFSFSNKILGLYR